MRAILGLASISLCLFAGTLPQEGKRWWSHIQVLADDKMEGRNAGSEGHRKAADFVAGEFERAGLKPAGTQGYLQQVKFKVAQLDEKNSSMSIVRKGRTTVLDLGDDVMLTARAGLASSVDAPAVFVGHALSIPEREIDDFAGLDLKGKILVYINGGPASVPSALKSHYSSRAERWKAVQKTGAIGLVEIPNPKSMDIPWSRATLSRLAPTMVLADEKLEETKGMKFSARINPASAEKFFEDSGHEFADILKMADADEPLPRFPLNLNIKAQLTMDTGEVESPNVVAMLPGTDARLKNEYVVYGAHLDHLGVGEAINGDKIYNGAMDDASGVASLIEIATMIKEQKLKFKRSLLFVAVTGEEKGLLGSRFFASYPTVPRGSIVADINMDMFLPLFPLKYLEVQGLGESTLGDQIRDAAKAAHVTVQADQEPDRNLFIRSDQYSFIKEGVPALAFKFGYEKGSPQEKLAKDWLANRYHAPSDDLNQPVDLAAAAQFDRILLDLGTRVANAEDRPHWKSESFFRRFAKD